MLEKRTLLSEVTTRFGSAIYAQLLLQVIDDGEIISSKQHTVVVLPGQDVAEVVAMENANIERMKYPAMEDFGALTSQVARDHTPEYVASWKAAQKSSIFSGEAT